VGGELYVLAVFILGNNPRLTLKPTKRRW